jgi:hypothetical protein
MYDIALIAQSLALSASLLVLGFSLFGLLYLLARCCES